MKLLFFWFSLNKNSQLQLPIHWEKTKNEILSDILQESLEYQYYSKIVYKFNKKIENFIIWEIWRKSSKTISIPSEEWFKDIKNDHYPHAKIIFNVSENYEEEQWHRVWFEYKSDLFKNPESQMKHLEDELNIKLKNYWYAISFYPLSDENTFWTFVNQNKWNIEKLTFTYSVPNFLWLKNSLTDDLKTAWENYWITNTTIVLENKNGALNINENDPLIKQSVEYSSLWAWEFKVKAKWVKVEFTSKQNIKSISMDELEIDSNTNKDILQKLFSKLK